MYTALGCATLKDGSTAEIAVVRAPDDVFGDGIRDLLVHKGADWQTHLDAALSGEADPLETRFYLALREGVPVANVMIVERYGVGILGHVFTRPEVRRLGLCRAVLESALRDFEERGGRALVLGTGFESPAYWIYHSFGFRSLDGGFMRFSIGNWNELEPRWFAHSPARAAQAAWEHWPLMSLLASCSSSDPMRSIAWDVRHFGNLEWPFCHFLHTTALGEEAQAVVLQSNGGAVVGCASIYPLRLAADRSVWPGVWSLDLFAHPNFETDVDPLFVALEPPVGKLVCLVDPDAHWKADALRRQGFALETVLPTFQRTASRPVDTHLFSKEIG